MNNKTKEKGRIDWLITLVPFILIMGVAILLFIFPEGSNEVISKVRFFFGDTLGSYYYRIGCFACRFVPILFKVWQHCFRRSE